MEMSCSNRRETEEAAHSDTLLHSTFPGMQEAADRKGAEEEVERVGICCLSRHLWVQNYGSTI